MNLLDFGLGIKQQELDEVIQQLVGIVNNQGKEIQKMQRLIEKKSESQLISNTFKQLGESFSFNDAEVRKTLRIQQTNMNKHSGKEIEDHVDRMSERLFLMSKGWDYSIDINRQYGESIKKSENAIAMKGDKTYIKKKNKKNKQWTKVSMEQLEDRILRRLGTQQQEQKKDCLRIEAALKENEKKTLHKIQDCEQLLLNRVNEEYVEQAIKVMDGKIVREIGLAVNKGLKEVNKQIDHNREQSHQLQEEQNERSKRIERQLMEESQRVKETYMERIRGEEINRRNEGQIEGNRKRVEEVESRGNANQVEEKGNIRMGKVEEQLSTMERRLKSIQTGVEDLSKGMEGKEGEGGMEHAVCGLEFGLKQVRDQTEELDYQLKRVDRQLEIKYQFMEQNVMDQLNKLKTNNDEKEELKEEFIKITEKGNAKVTNDINNFTKRVNEVEDRVDIMGKIEPRVDKLEDQSQPEKLSDYLDEKIGEIITKKVQLWEKDGQQKQQEVNEMRDILEEQGDALSRLQQQVDGNGGTEEIVSVFSKKTQVEKLRCMACGVQYMSTCKNSHKHPQETRLQKQNNELYQLPYGKVTHQEQKAKQLS